MIFNNKLNFKIREIKLKLSSLNVLLELSLSNSKTNKLINQISEEVFKHEILNGFCLFLSDFLNLNKLFVVISNIYFIIFLCVLSDQRPYSFFNL